MDGSEGEAARRAGLTTIFIAGEHSDAGLIRTLLTALTRAEVSA